jgi:hypothetical protein
VVVPPIIERFAGLGRGESIRCGASHGPKYAGFRIRVADKGFSRKPRPIPGLRDALRCLLMPTTDRPEPDRPEPGEPTNERRPRRVSVPEAALLLGISEDAVRSRLRRRTLRKEKAPDGGVFVLLLGDEPRDKWPTDRDQQTTDQTTDEHPSAREAPSPELVEELRDRMAYLERQVEEEREARREEGRELRRLLAGLIERVPELEARQAPPDAPGSAPGDAKEPGGGQGPPETSTASEGRSAPPRSWWRRLLGG